MPVPMVKELIKLRDEAERLLEVYTEHKDSEFYDLQRRVHLDLDRFLMEHREEAILLMVDGLNEEIKKMVDKTKPIKKVHMLSRIMMALRRSTPAEPERDINHYEEPVVFELPQKGEV